MTKQQYLRKLIREQIIKTLKEEKKYAWKDKPFFKPTRKTTIGHPQIKSEKPDWPNEEIPMDKKKRKKMQADQLKALSEKEYYDEDYYETLSMLASELQSELNEMP